MQDYNRLFFQVNAWMFSSWVGKVSAIFPGKPEPDGQQGCRAHNHRIVKVGNDFNGTDAGYSAGDEELGSVWQQSLYATGESVEQAGTFAFVYAVFLGNVIGQSAGSENGDGVVGCGRDAREGG